MCRSLGPYYNEITSIIELTKRQKQEKHVFSNTLAKPYMHTRLHRGSSIGVINFIQCVRLDQMHELHGTILPHRREELVQEARNSWGFQKLVKNKLQDNI